MATTPEMVHSVNTLNLTDRIVTKEDIYELLGISVGTAHKIVNDDLGFLRSVVIGSLECWYQSTMFYATARTVETIR